MKIVDAHIHLSNIEVLKQGALQNPGIEYSLEGLIAEFDEAGIEMGIGMGLTEVAPDTFPCSAAINPMTLDMVNTFPERLKYCPGFNPHSGRLDELEKALSDPVVVGVKIYAGYYHFHLMDPVHQPVYELAAHYGKPVVIHTGDTHSARGLLKYSHPLAVDELAVTHRNINFIIAHVGYPWLTDAAAVVYKNENVFADVSGLIVGEKDLARYQYEELFVHQIRTALVYTDFEKYLFGTDWPLIRIKPYLAFVKRLFPERSYADLFYGNASRVFNI